MYFEDHYDPNEENDYDDSDSIIESISTVVNNNTRRKWLDDIKSTDPGYGYVTRLVKKPISLGLKVDVLCSNSNGPDSYYSGKIVRINNDKHIYDVLLDNGDRRNGVSKTHICFPHSVVKGVKTKIPYYFNSLNPNVTIRNAVNGDYERGCKTGSTDEDLFFKVILATGEGGSRDSRILFFSDPQQYERYFHCTVSGDVKDQWTRKAMIVQEKHAKRTSSTRSRNTEIR